MQSAIIIGYVRRFIDDREDLICLAEAFEAINELRLIDEHVDLFPLLERTLFGRDHRIKLT